MKPKKPPPPADPVAGFLIALADAVRLDDADAELDAVTDATTPEARALERSAMTRFAALEIGDVIAAALKGDNDACVMLRRMHGIVAPTHARTRSTASKDDRTARAVASVKKFAPKVNAGKPSTLGLLVHELAAVTSLDLVDVLESENERAWLVGLIGRRLSAERTLAEIIARHTALKMLGHTSARNAKQIEAAIRQGGRRRRA